MSPSGGSTVLEFRDVCLYFGETAALDHMSFSMSGGDSRIVFGVAGAGKTTLLKVALGLVKPDSGRVYIFGQDATDLKESDWFHLRARMGILFQEGGLFDSMNIAENVAYPLVNQPGLRDRLGQNGELSERVREALRFVELEHTLEKFPSELSGGMRRRVGIARAIVTEPPLLLYDSPTAGLDPITANTIINLIIKERDLRNTAAIMITHRYQDGHMMANLRYNPSSGKIERSGVGTASGAGESQSTTKFMVMKEGQLVF